MIVAWSASIVASILAVVVYGARRHAAVAARRLRWDLLGQRWRSALRHHALTIAIQVPGWAMPLVAVGVLSARTNAGFFFAWQLLGLATFALVSLNWMFFAAARPRARLDRQGLAHAPGLARHGSDRRRVLWILGPPAPAILGPGYAADGTAALRYLPLMLFPLAIKNLYVSVHRVRDDATGALAVVGLGAGWRSPAAWSARRRGAA